MTLAIKSLDLFELICDYPYHILQVQHPILYSSWHIPSQLKEIADRNIHKGTHQSIPQIPQLHTQPSKLVVYIFASQLFVVHV